jgi:ABC-type glutathione transport system ATPase component
MGGSRGKRKREDDHTIAACTHLNRSEFSRRIKDIRGKLRDLARDVSDALKIDGSNLPVTSNLIQSTRLTSSFLLERKVYGRDAEVKSILELIARSRSNITVTVLPVVGMGGIGKTTLAQLVYNHSKVESHFQNKIWVCVSDNFDVRRVTREILDRVSETKGTRNRLLGWASGGPS